MASPKNSRLEPSAPPGLSVEARHPPHRLGPGLRRGAMAQPLDQALVIVARDELRDDLLRVRLFSHGLDSSALPPDHPAVARLREKLKRSGSRLPEVGRGGRLSVGREQVARLLRILGDSLADRLIAIGNDGLTTASARNHSILIHGYEAVGVADGVALRELYGKLQAVVVEDLGPEGTARLAVARFHGRTSQRGLTAATKGRKASPRHGGMSFGGRPGPRPDIKSGPCRDRASCQAHVGQARVGTRRGGGLVTGKERILSLS